MTLILRAPLKTKPCEKIIMYQYEIPEGSTVADLIAAVKQRNNCKRHCVAYDACGLERLHEKAPITNEMQDLGLSIRSL